MPKQKVKIPPHSFVRGCEVPNPIWWGETLGSQVSSLVN